MWLYANINNNKNKTYLYWIQSKFNILQILPYLALRKVCSCDRLELGVVCLIKSFEIEIEIEFVIIGINIIIAFNSTQQQHNNMEKFINILNSEKTGTKIFKFKTCKINWLKVQI